MVEIVTISPSLPATPGSGGTKSSVARVRRGLSSLGLRTPRLFRGPRVEAPLVAPVLQTERLIIRPHRLSDAQAWYAIQSDDGVLRFLSWPHRSRSQSLQHLKDRTRHTTLSQANDLLALAIEFDGQLVGDLSLHLRTVHPDFRSAEIGWILASSHGGVGLAGEAVCAAIDMMFDRLDVKWISAVVDVRNERSLALATRLRFFEDNRDGHYLTMVQSRDQRQPCSVPREKVDPDRSRER